MGGRCQYGGCYTRGCHGRGMEPRWYARCAQQGILTWLKQCLIAFIIGMSILISHHPPRLSIHSIQDGRQERSVPIPPPYYSDVRLLPTANFRITNVWWLRYEDAKKKGPEMPDFFKRNKTIVSPAPHSPLAPDKYQLVHMHRSARLRTFTVEDAASSGPFKRRDCANHVGLLEHFSPVLN